MAALDRAALEPEAWSEALGAMVQLCGGQVGNLLGVGGPGWLQANWYSGVAPETPAALVESGVADPARNPRLRAGLAVGVMQVQADDEILRHESRDRYPLYKELDRLETGRAMWVSVHREPELNVALCIGGDHFSGAAPRQDREQFARAAALAGQAVRLQIALEQRGAAVLADSLEALAAAAFVCGADGRVLRATPTGEALLRRGDRLRLREGRLQARRLQDEARLAAAVAQAAVDGEAVSRTVMVTDAEGGRPLALAVARLRRGPYCWARTPAVLVLARADPTDSGARALAETFDLTPSEARVAEALARGCSAEEIAAARQVSVQTVRSQVKAIYGKTGATRQSELVRLVLGAGAAP